MWLAIEEFWRYSVEIELFIPVEQFRQWNHAVRRCSKEYVETERHSGFDKHTSKPFKIAIR